MIKTMSSMFLVMVMLSGLVSMGWMPKVFLLHETNNNEAQAASSVNIGDYIQFGKYNRKPILWRVIHKDDSGNPILLSDRILTLKAFDAKGNYHKDPERFTNGSNYYPDSNIRQWLNSNSLNTDENTIDWIQNDPIATNMNRRNNPYNTEKGFLAEGNFSSTELSFIKPYTHQVLLSFTDSSMKEGGTANHTFDGGNIPTVVQNYDTAYYKIVTDNVFLLSVKQLKEYVYDNSLILGANYYRAIPTAEAVNQSLYKHEGYLNSSKYWYYWLSSPLASSPRSVLYFSSLLSVQSTDAYNPNMGVRPALHLDLSSAIFTSDGKGTSSNPYVIGDGNGTIPHSDLIPPTDPKSLNLSNVTSSSVKIRWNASSDNMGVMTYEIYQDLIKIVTLSGNFDSAPDTTYNVLGLMDNTIYSFTIRAKDSAGNVSGPSNTLSVKTLDGTSPSIPSKLTLASITGTALTLSWSPSVDNVGVAGYEVYRNKKLIATTKTPKYRITSLNENTVQAFSVKAFDESKNKSSSSVSIKTIPTIKIIGKQLYSNFKLLNLGSGIALTTVKGQTLVPYKPILESMGLIVKYNSKTKTVTATKQGLSIKLTQGKAVAVVNEKNKTMPFPPTMINGKLMVPLVFVSKELGYQVTVSK